MKLLELAVCFAFGWIGTDIYEGRRSRRWVLALGVLFMAFSAISK